MTGGTRLPILQVSPADISEKVLVVGDPARAEAATQRLGGADRLGMNREYATYTGTFDGERITICSHGVGSAGAGVCFAELARAGARTVLRAGTCGAIQDGIEDGELVIATAAVRDEGLTARLVPAGFPAVADPRLVCELEACATRKGASCHVGLVLTSDLFYPSEALGVDWQPWKRSRVLAVEMELAALLVIASLHGIEAGGILTVDGNPTRAAQDMSEYDPYRPVVQEATEVMLDIALEVLARTGRKQ